MDTNSFQHFIRERGDALYRDMPWRQDTRPYYVLVSEIMLQQTQVSRALPKFEAFIARFPDEAVLAAAPLAEVLTLWQGLGYNRRAKYLHDAARQIVSQRGVFPNSRDDLMKLPGVGVNTAGAIMAYSYNQPVLFIETNIRTVYLHHFFVKEEMVEDAKILEVLARTIDHDQPREFYWALMDYGAWLKAQGVRNGSQSRTYRKQSPLAGSVREVRGAILRALAQEGSFSEQALRDHLVADARFTTALAGVERDGLVARRGNTLYLTK